MKKNDRMNTFYRAKIKKKDDTKKTSHVFLKRVFKKSFFFFKRVFKKSSLSIQKVVFLNLQTRVNGCM